MVQFTFISKLLAFRDLDQFKDFVNPVSQLLERFGNFRGMNHGLMNGQGIGRTKIGGFDPRFWTQRLRARRLRAAFWPGRGRGRMGFWRRHLFLRSRG
jgi:hypothetical protein